MKYRVTYGDLSGRKHSTVIEAKSQFEASLILKKKAIKDNIYVTEIKEIDDNGQMGKVE